MDRHHEREIEYYPMEGVQIQPLEQSVSPPGRRESTQSSIRDRIIRFTSPVQLDYSPLSPLSNDKSFSDERQPQGHSKGNSLVSVESKYSAIHPVHQQFLEASPTSPPAVLPKSPPLDIADSVKTWWGWWHPMFLMYVFFLLGVAAATGHHFYYASLHGTEVTDQFKRARYGAALSFVAKASLMASVILAFRQQMWATFRRKTLTVDAIDSIFAIMEDPTVMKWEAFKNAKVAMFLAFIVWISPLTVILTPGTLTVLSSIITNSTTCPGVQTLNFAPESSYDWRNPENIAGLNQQSLSYYNTTSLNTSDQYFFDYYTAPTPEGNLAATLSAYTQGPVARKDIAIQTCGAGWNCSYEITFVGPGYKCAEYGGGNDGAPIETAVLVPQGSYTYLAHATLGEYSVVQIDSGDSGIPKTAPPWPKTFGSFRTEPTIWVGYSVLKDESAPFPVNSSDPRWATAFDNKMFSCLHYETSYTVNFNYTAGIQNATVTNRKFIAPILDTEFLRGVDANDGTKDNITAVPADAYILPQDVAKYRLTAAYHSLGLQLRTHINGSLSILPSGVAKTETGATSTKLIDIRHYIPKPDLIDGIQSLYEDMILSLLSNPQLIVVAWAAQPNIQSGTVSDGPQWPCKKSRNLNVFDYRVRDLWLVYGAFIFLAAISILFGMKAVQQNAGHFKKNRFSAIVAATRGPELDSVAWRTDAHGRMPRGVGKTRLGYGIARQGMGGQRGSYVGRGVDDGFGEMFYRSEIDRAERGV